MPTCPKCQSKKVEKLNYGKRVGATIGGLGGAAGGAATAMGGAVAGGKAGAATFGFMAGPAGAASVAGRAVDEHILDNYRCFACGYKFNEE